MALSFSSFCGFWLAEPFSLNFKTAKRSPSFMIVNLSRFEGRCTGIRRWKLNTEQQPSDAEHEASFVYYFFFLAHHVRRPNIKPAAEGEAGGGSEVGEGGACGRRRGTLWGPPAAKKKWESRQPVMEERAARTY